MTVVTKHIEVEVRAEEMVDITGEVKREVKDSKVRNGIVTIFVPGSTGVVSTMEYEPGLLKDIPRALERIAPSNIDYEHHKTWHDDNGRSHVRATLMGPSLVVPFVDGNPVLGTWQQIVFMNLDTSHRRRKVVLQILGE
ncbi:MAG: secondary thiamine-phosphate synthase enzyme YjbQ [Candidatus Hydrothermarchaeales archaeon]